MIINSPEEMQKYWKDLAKSHKVILLTGELWAGKTTLIKGFAEGIWINPEKIQSPTYAYVNIYDDLLLHIDMYRLNTFNELVEKGILNQISEYEYIVIERIKREESLDLDNPLHINIKKISAEKREVSEIP